MEILCSIKWVIVWPWIAVLINLTGIICAAKYFELKILKYAKDKYPDIITAHQCSKAFWFPWDPFYRKLKNILEVEVYSDARRLVVKPDADLQLVKITKNLFNTIWFVWFVIIIVPFLIWLGYLPLH